MADTAAFFAKKKKKKKAFKFNANNIDATSVMPTVHVDAPALSTESDVNGFLTSAQNTANNISSDGNDGGEWDDEAMAATLTKKSAPNMTGNSTTELLDMKALDLKQSEQGGIAEKLRVEETRAQLAAAREGMEREAQRMKEEKEKKEQEAAASKPRFSAAAGSMAASGGGKWVPPHMRGGAGGGVGSISGRGDLSGVKKLDTQDDTLFPDLAAADKIAEQQKKQQTVYKPPKKTPVGAGASWANKPKVPHQKKASELKSIDNHPPKEENEPTATTKKPPEEEQDPKQSPAPTTSTATAASSQPIKPKKKKKKDLSTFKPSS